MKLIAPSILSANFAELGKEIHDITDAGADWIHIDVMDGHFVPNITMGPDVVSAVKKITTLPLDVHLMITNPDDCIDMFADAGADLITVHAETCPHLHRTVQCIREKNVRPGVVLNPSTPLSALEWILDHIDLVLIMSVNPGFGGQKFIPNSLEKIRLLRDMIQELELNTLIQVDGGVNTKTIKDAAAAGVDVFVAGSAIFGSDDYSAAIAEFRTLIDQGEKENEEEVE